MYNGNVCQILIFLRSRVVCFYLNNQYFIMMWTTSHISKSKFKTFIFHEKSQKQLFVDEMAHLRYLAIDSTDFSAFGQLVQRIVSLNKYNRS